jgi:transcriptional regulator NrdR family protein
MSDNRLKEKEKTAEEEIHSTVKNVIKSQSPEEGKRLRFPCSYCSRRFKTLEEVKRHIRYAHTPRRRG